MSWLPSNDPALGDARSCDALELVIVPRTRDLGDGFAVRRALSQPDKLREAMQQLVDAGQVDPAEFDAADPLGFVLAESDATSIVDAAYRFCRYEPGVHVVLSGTGNPAHLQSNIDSLCKPPLPDGVVQKLRHLFRNANAVTGQ